MKRPTQTTQIGRTPSRARGDKSAHRQTIRVSAHPPHVSWSAGAAQLGYGDGDEATLLSYGGDTLNRYITSYFRRSFTVANPAALGALTVRFIRDDGAVVYVNGVEVIRSNMPTGAVTYTTRATAAIGGTDESAWIQASIDPALLVTGTNVLAVEIHQQSPSSSDISFDLELKATEAAAPGPTVTLTSPANHSVTNTPAVTFSATASAPAGLVSATLYISGPPQTVVFSGPAQVEDAQITADTPTLANGDGASVNVDGQTPHAHGLMKFPTLIGGGAGRVPSGAIVTSAVLQLNCTNAGNAMQLYRLTEDWIENEATWNTRATGVAWASAGAGGAGSNAGVALPGDCTTTGQRLLDVTRFVQEWSNGAPNYGLVLIETGTDGIDFTSSESSPSPVLSVVYKSSPQSVGTQVLSGTTAAVSVAGDLLLGQTYYWNLRVTDVNGQETWAPADFELIADAASPDAPVLVSPAGGSTGVPTSPILAALVSDPAGGTLSVGAALRQAAAPEFTIVAWPDTQHYSEAFPAIFTSQTQWIVDNKSARNIVFVTHEGDIVEHNSVATEWVRANTSMSLLDGVVPYGMGPGNHDQPTTLYNQYFPYTRYQNEPWYGGHFQSLNDNNYQLFSGGGMDFVIVHMEFCPPAAAVTWADSVFKTYPNRIGIMTTHGYINASAQRTVSGCANTQYLWDGLAVPNPNLHFMLSGHVHDESRRVDTANGHPVFQMLADFQDRASGGEGWLRILRFVPAEGKVYVQTYSPWLGRFESDANSEFTLDFPMGGAFSSLGTVTAASGSTTSITAAGLAPNTRYEWQVTVTNSSGKSRTGPVWSFTTEAEGPVNRAPVAMGEPYTVQADSTLTVNAPGVLANDTDLDGGVLTAQLVGVPAHGALALAANGSFAYTPGAGYSGPDSFTYQANDGQAASGTATVSLTVTPPPPPPPPTPVVVFSANFDAGQNSFTYADNTFRGATQSSYASGSRVTTGGFTGGALRVRLGGINDTLVNGMSGGWRRTFTLSAPAALTLSLRYNLDQGADYESDEISQVLASVNGTLLAAPPADYVAQVAGNGNGGTAIGSGWQLVDLPLGTLPAGTHTLILGGYNSKKNSTAERTTILIDDVTIVAP